MMLNKLFNLSKSQFPKLQNDIFEIGFPSDADPEKGSKMLEHISLGGDPKNYQKSSAEVNKEREGSEWFLTVGK